MLKQGRPVTSVLTMKRTNTGVNTQDIKYISASVSSSTVVLVVLRVEIWKN